MADAGLSGLILNAVYHPITALSARQSAAIFSVPDGGAFFPANPKGYGRLRPLVSADAEVTAVWRQVGAAAHDRGMFLDAWVVGLFQPGLARAFPDTARRFVTGAVNDHGLCPSAPDVVEHVEGVVSDLIGNLGVRFVRLEAFDYPQYDYGWTRRRVMTPVSPLARDILSLCFCRSCVARAANQGIDVDQLRHRLSGILESELRGDRFTKCAVHELSDPEAEVYVATMNSSVDELLHRAAESARRSAGIPALMISARERTARAPRDFVSILPQLGGLMVEGASAARELEPGVRSKLVVDSPVFPWALINGDSAVADEVVRQLDLDPTVDEASIYHFGLLNNRQFKVILKGVQDHLRTRRTADGVAGWEGHGTA